MAEPKPKKAESTKRIVDIKSEGDAASGTSRPLIVTNRSIVKDPMMAEISQLTGGVTDDSETPTPTGKGVPEDASGAPEIVKSSKVAIGVDKHEADSTEKAGAPDESTSAQPPSKKKIIIKPLQSESTDGAEPKIEKKEPTVAELAMPNIDEITDTPTEEQKPVITDKPEDVIEAEPTAPEDIPSKATEDTEGTSSQTKKSKSDEKSAAVPADEEIVTAALPGRSFDGLDTQAGDAQLGPEQIELDSKGKSKQKEKKSGELTVEQQQAFESGEYFLPITTAETKRLRREIIFATLFVTVLIVVWLDIMLDAGLLQVGGLKAVTNFF